MKTILALVDFSDVTARVLAQAQELAKAFAGRVIIMHVLKQEPVVLDAGLASPTVLRPPEEAVVQAGKATLEGFRFSMAATGINVTAQQLPDATMEKLLEEGARLGADIIVVGSHHHSALYDLFIGSFTHDLLKLATCPVLVVPAVTGAGSP
jgi:nucleotide-binding universal stress UspA family protein